MNNLIRRISFTIHKCDNYCRALKLKLNWIWFNDTGIYERNWNVKLKSKI